MKNKIYSGVFIVALVALATLNINLNKVGNTYDFNMANVEALAEEAGVTVPCYQTVSSGGNTPIYIVRYCGDCTATSVRKYSSTSTCVTK